MEPRETESQASFSHIGFHDLKGFDRPALGEFVDLMIELLQKAAFLSFAFLVFLAVLSRLPTVLTTENAKYT